MSLAIATTENASCIVRDVIEVVIPSQNSESLWIEALVRRMACGMYLYLNVEYHEFKWIFIVDKLIVIECELFMTSLIYLCV